MDGSRRRIDSKWIRALPAKAMSRLIQKVRYGLHNGVERRRYDYSDSLRVMEEDWDNLILLDGCRYDIFREECSIDGELDGKTVITTDHGEMLGDPSTTFSPRRFGHGQTKYAPELRHVPWLVPPIRRTEGIRIRGARE